MPSFDTKIVVEVPFLKGAWVRLDSWEGNKKRVKER